MRSSSSRPGGHGDVEPDAALAAVALLHHEVDAADAEREAGGREAALRVTAHRVFDLHDLGAPVREHGARRRHEPPLGDFEHLDPRERSRHRMPSPLPAHSMPQVPGGWTLD